MNTIHQCRSSITWLQTTDASTKQWNAIWKKEVHRIRHWQFIDWLQIVKNLQVAYWLVIDVLCKFKHLPGQLQVRNFFLLVHGQHIGNWLSTEVWEGGEVKGIHDLWQTNTVGSCNWPSKSMWSKHVISGFMVHTEMKDSFPVWLIEHGFTSAPTQYRLYGRRFLQVWWPNQQCQSTEGGWLVIQTGLRLTRLTSPCYNTITCMQILHKKII